MATALSVGIDVDDDRVERAAKRLLRARVERTPLRALPEDVRPRSVAEAYAIQDRVADAIGPVGGWKVGAKGAAADPTCAPLCTTWLVASPADVPGGAFRLNGIEAEVAFRLARDLPFRDAPYRESDVAAAIASVHPVIEIVDSRFVEIAATDPLSLLADSNSHGALVIGAGVALPDRFSVARQAVELDIDDRPVVRARDSNPAGDPLRLLAWLANHAARRRGGLSQGAIVTTGSWTGLRFVTPHGRVVARFPGIGEASVRFGG